MIEIITDGEYARNDEIQIIMRRSDARFLIQALLSSGREFDRDLAFQLEDALNESE